MTTDAKGPLLTDLEDFKQAGIDRVKQMYAEKKLALGSVKLGDIHQSPDDKAKSLLPDYYARGLARGPIAYAYWREKIDQYGLKGAVQFHADMERLMDSHAHWSTPITAATPDQQRQTTLLRQQGLHRSVPEQLRPSQGVIHGIAA